MPSMSLYGALGGPPGKLRTIGNVCIMGNPIVYSKLVKICSNCSYTKMPHAFQSAPRSSLPCYPHWIREDGKKLKEVAIAIAVIAMTTITIITTISTAIITIVTIHSCNNNRYHTSNNDNNNNNNNDINHTVLRLITHHNKCNQAIASRKVKAASFHISRDECPGLHRLSLKPSRLQNQINLLNIRNCASLTG